MEVSEHAVRALTRLDELGGAEGSQIYDPILSHALAPLIAHPAMAFHCARCQDRVAWWTLHSRLALIVFAERRATTKTRRAGTSDLDQARDDDGLEPWIDQATRPGGRIQISEWSGGGNTSGYPLRVTFQCGCGAEYVTRNSSRLRAFLTSRKVGSSRILL